MLESVVVLVLLMGASPTITLLLKDVCYEDCLTPLQQQLTNLQGKIESLEKIVKEPTIAFHAELSRDLINPLPNTRIIFDKVNFNSGNSYSNHSGAFICPTRGVYFFSLELSANAHPNSNHNLHAKILKNGHPVSITVLDSEAHLSWVRRTSSVTTELAQNDVISVLINYTTGNTTVSGGSALSTFSGFLVNRIF